MQTITKNSTKVFIQSIPRETATKISDWTNDTSGKKLKKTKIGRCRDTIMALYNPKYGGLANGLSYKPWMENGKQKTDESGNKLTLQDREEQRWNLPKGYLNNRAWRRGDSTKHEEMPYFQTASWKLNDGSTVLDLANFEDAMFYYVALDSKFIANSEAEWRAHKWPKATHYIALENEAEELKYKRTQIKSEAFAKLHHKNMDPVTRRKTVSALGLAKATAYLTEEQVHNLLFDFIDKSGYTDGSNIDKFNEIFQLTTNAKGREELEARVLLQKSIDARVVYEKQGGYNWNRAEGLITLGETLSEAIDFIMNPKKEALVEELEEEIKAKLGE